MDEKKITAQGMLEDDMLDEVSGGLSDMAISSRIEEPVILHPIVFPAEDKK